MHAQNLKSALRNHPLYTRLNQPEALRFFMEHHVFAVWDFMSLLKKLQLKLTCVRIPWVPVESAEARFLINEIVAGEESDLMPNGTYLSHFEIYLEAMRQCGASTVKIEEFVSQIRSGIPPLDIACVPTPARNFMSHTFSIIKNGKLHELAAAFTLGREDLIPNMFQGMVAALNAAEKGRWSLFLYYLERHIEIDGGHHKQLALRLVDSLCAGDPRKQDEANAAGVRALLVRLEFWDTIHSLLPQSQS